MKYFVGAFLVAVLLFAGAVFGTTMYTVMRTAAGVSSDIIKMNDSDGDTAVNLTGGTITLAADVAAVTALTGTNIIATTDIKSDLYKSYVEPTDYLYYTDNQLGVYFNSSPLYLFTTSSLTSMAKPIIINGTTQNFVGQGVSDYDSDTYIYVEENGIGEDTDTISLAAGGVTSLTVTKTTITLAPANTNAMTATSAQVDIGVAVELDSTLAVAGNSAFTGTVKVGGNGVIEGDTTGGRVLRRNRLKISGDNGGVYVDVQGDASYKWNCTQFSSENNLAKGATGTNFSLSAGGGELTIEDANIDGTVAGILGANIVQYNSDANNLVVEPRISGSDIVLLFSISTNGGEADLPTTECPAAGDYIDVDVLYITDS